jgi:hypothetical protein
LRSTKKFKKFWFCSVPSGDALELARGQKNFLANDYKFVMLPKLRTAAVSAVAEVDRPQPGGAGCGRFLPTPNGRALCAEPKRSCINFVKFVLSMMTIL